MSAAIFRRAHPTRLTTGLGLLSRRMQSSYDHLNAELAARKIPITYDYLVPTSTHLLNVSLRDFLPKAADTPSGTSARVLPSASRHPQPLPPAHHLIYFPPSIPSADLLPDGTDPLQSPGEPFVRRMWAGGSVRFNNAPGAHTLTALNGQRAACLEAIRDVTIKGKPGDEKLFVGIERRIGRTSSDDEPEDSIRARFWKDDAADFGDAVGIIERRNIVFMRERSKEQALKDMEAAKNKKLAPPTDTPDWSHELLPDPKLLFRYSALTYNAHSIHLDPEYCREVEGHRDLLVHGPLSFTLLVTLLNHQLGSGQAIKNIEYRNLSPLYCNERLRLCGRRVTEGKGDWEVWAETPEGGVAVKANVWVENI